MLQYLHHLAYVQNRTLSSVESIIFLFSSIVLLADFFNSSGQTSRSVIAFWDFVAVEATRIYGYHLIGVEGYQL